MSREVFLRELESLLADITAEEREEALQYYEDYFADAGPEYEAQVIQELGSPQRVAAMIKAGLKGGMEGGEFTEHGYRDQRFEEKASPVPHEPERQKQSQSRYSYAGQGRDFRENPNKPWSNRWLKILLIVLIIIFAAPVAIPVVIAAAAVLIGLICAVLGLFFGLVIGACSVVIAGIAILVVGVSKLILVPSAALLTMGIGLLILVIGLIAAAASIRLCIIIYPAIFRFFVEICRKPFHRKAGI